MEAHWNSETPGGNATRSHVDCRLTRRAVLIYGRSNKNFVFEFEGGVYFPSLFLLAEIHVLASVSPEKNNAHTKQPSNSA